MKTTTPWGASSKAVNINGHEAHLLLFLLDEYMGGIAGGAREPITVYDNAEDLASLRDRLFRAHEHPDGEDNDGAS